MAVWIENRTFIWEAANMLGSKEWLIVEYMISMAVASRTI
jgi:hypothetical protein